MHDSKLLVRAARLLKQAWRQAAQRTSQQLDTAFDHLDQNHLVLQQARRHFDRARNSLRGTPLANVVRVVTARLQQLRTAGDEVSEHLKQTHLVAPAGKFLLAEIRQLEADFDGLTIEMEQKFIATQTERVVLEGLDLGPFAIRFFWERLNASTDYLCFDIVALDPKPSGVDEDTTHPHVKHEKLCAGDATTPIRLALEQGRLADAFSLIRSVLMTYNPHSPFVALDAWDGSTCDDCGDSVSSDELRYCEGCDQDYCAECISYCSACEDARCSGCLSRCAVCEETCCRSCLQVMEASGRNCCPNCIRNCSVCLEDFPKDELVEESELCPLCRSRQSAPLEEPSVTPVDQSTPTFSESTHAQSQEFCAVAQPVV